MEGVLSGLLARGAQVPESPEFAAALDAVDNLASLKSRFHFPPTPSAARIRTPGASTVYLCGNSLGLQPTATADYVAAELRKWATHGVEGHFTEPKPWLTYDETVKASMAAVVGAQPSEVAVMGSLTANLHALMCAFYAPKAGERRRKILLEDHAFPSDAHVAFSQALLRGLAPADALIKVKPRAGEDLLRTEDVIAAITAAGDELAVILLPGVQYYTGQLLDIPAITAAAHAVGAIAGWDLAHAAGNVPLRLHGWGVDFAAWCSYKYLNSGPGGVGAIFVHERHANDSLEHRPRLAGWWGHRLSDRFLMAEEHIPSPGAAGYQLSNAPVLPTACLRASLDEFEAAGGMGALRAKSVALTRYLEVLLTRALGGAGSGTGSGAGSASADAHTGAAATAATGAAAATPFRIITPADPCARGAQLSLCLPMGPGEPALKQVQRRLGEEGVIVDTREPCVMRVAAAPLYNSAADVLAFVTTLSAVMAELRSAAQLQLHASVGKDGAESDGNTV